MEILTVYNNSDKPRYHFIVHGDVNPKLVEGAYKQLQMRLEDEGQKEFVMVIYNQLDRIENTAMYFRFKGSSNTVLSQEITKQSDIFFGDSIKELLETTADEGYDYCVVLAAGTALKSFKYDREIRNFIMKDKDFGVAGHCLMKPDHWAELHHQFFIVNLMHGKKLVDLTLVHGKESLKNSYLFWKEVKRIFIMTILLLWVRVNKDKKRTKQPFAGQGWELLKAMFEE